MLYKLKQATIMSPPLTTDEKFKIFLYPGRLPELSNYCRHGPEGNSKIHAEFLQKFSRVDVSHCGQN